MASLPPPLSALERRLGLEEGSLSGPDRARAEEAIADASALALAEVSTATAAAWATSAPAVAVTVVLKAARREYENPQGYSQESVGDYAYSVSASGVYLTDAEVAQIRRAAGQGARGGFTGTVRTPSAYEGDTTPPVIRILPQV